MPTRKIADLPSSRPCRHPDHEPPRLRLFTPGVYEHECPACHRVLRFVVPETGRLSSAQHVGCVTTWATYGA